MATHVRSYSKINLGLAIGPVRPDGFHGLTTLYQTLDLHDVVTVSVKGAADTRIALTTNHPAPVRKQTSMFLTHGAASCMTRAATTTVLFVLARPSVSRRGGIRRLRTLSIGMRSVRSSAVF